MNNPYLAVTVNNLPLHGELIVYGLYAVGAAGDVDGRRHLLGIIDLPLKPVPLNTSTLVPSMPSTLNP